MQEFPTPEPQSNINKAAVQVFDRYYETPIKLGKLSVNTSDEVRDAWASTAGAFPQYSERIMGIYHAQVRSREARYLQRDSQSFQDTITKISEMIPSPQASLLFRDLVISRLPTTFTGDQAWQEAQTLYKELGLSISMNMTAADKLIEKVLDSDCRLTSLPSE